MKPLCREFNLIRTKEKAAYMAASLFQTLTVFKLHEQLLLEERAVADAGRS